nr:YlbF family regulator [Brevibacillus laterosporus]
MLHYLQYILLKKRGNTVNYDKAHELARAIKDSDEYKTFLTAQQNVSADPDASRMLADFRQKQFELQMKQMSGQEVGQEDIEQIQKLYETVQIHQDIRKVLEAERVLGQIMEDVNRIIAEPLQVLYGIEK